MKQSEIVAEMKVLPEIDVEFEVRRRVDFIKYELELSAQKTLVLGISGGVDSCTCGRLAQLAIDELAGNGNGYRFVAVRLPYATQADEADAQLAIDFIQPSHSVVNVQAGTDAIHRRRWRRSSRRDWASTATRHRILPRGNVKARMRMVTQYEIAGLLGGLVLGTDHSAENVTGFYTKYGDGACDIIPLFGLNKRQVRQLARHLGAPEKIIEKAPTADLETLDPSKPDEDALGLTYDQIDDFLEGKQIDPEAADRMIHISSRHRAQATADRHRLRSIKKARRTVHAEPGGANRGVRMTWPRIAGRRDYFAHAFDIQFDVDVADPVGHAEIGWASVSSSTWLFWPTCRFCTNPLR